jgi:hypothetical protein
MKADVWLVRKWLLIVALSVVGLFAQIKTATAQVTTTMREELIRAASEAGFEVRSVKIDQPTVAHSQYPFTSFEYDDPMLVELREKYQLQTLIEGAADEWTAQQLLKDWVFHQIPGGDPESSPRNALQILERAAKGETFYCTFYAITYLECAHALGWQARKIGVDRKHSGGRVLGSSHHGVAEVWSNQFSKWVLMDSQSNLHFEKEGVPLNAYEIRAEWLLNKGEDVHHIVGAPPHRVERNPAMVWRVPDADEIATYYWLYVQDSAAVSSADSRFLLLEDEHNVHEIWYQNDRDLGHSQFHNAYLQNRFEPTNQIEDLYWTVGIVEAKVVKVVPGAIHFQLNSNCPNFAAYEKSGDGAVWSRTEEMVCWSLQPGWNTLGLRTVNRAGVTGPETSFVLLLKDTL